MFRVTKIGQSLGVPEQPYNGVGQGDPLSLIPALLLVSMQFKMLDHLHPSVSKGAVVDDRNLRGPRQDVLDAYDCVHAFDLLAGQELQHSKTVFAATHQCDRVYLKGITLHGTNTTIKGLFVLVGDVISAQMKRSKEQPDKRVADALTVAKKLLSLKFGRGLCAHAVSTSVIPRMTYGTQWALPSVAALSKLRSAILSGIWGQGSRLRCSEIVLGLMHDPTRVDPTFACLFRTFSHTRQMVFNYPKRYGIISGASS